MKAGLRVWFHRVSSIAWVLIGGIAFLLGWNQAIWAVWIASVYANVKSDWAAAEAADDSAVLARLDEIERKLDLALNRGGQE